LKGNAQIIISELEELELQRCQEHFETRLESEDEFWEFFNARTKFGYNVDREKLHTWAWNLFGEDIADELIPPLRKLTKRQSSKIDCEKKKIKANPLKYFQNHKFIPMLLGEDISKNHLKMFSDGTSLYFYDCGVYKCNGEEQFKRVAQEVMGDEWRKRYVSEALEWARIAMIPSNSESINPDDGYINVKNGLLDWGTGKLIEHTPKRLSTIQLPVDYDPDANDPVIMKFLRNIMPDDAIDTICEMIGYCLTTHTKYEKAVMLIGSGGNGKSTFTNMLSAFVGKENISNVSLQDLEKNRFKLAELQNKLVNTYADLPRTDMSNSSSFKAIVSGDSINVERKNKDPFDFRPFAKLIFSTNEFPRSADMTDGFYRRWFIIPFDKKFTPDKADVKLIEKLTTPSALSTLLNYAIDGLRRLDQNGRFTEGETIKKAVDQYRYMYDNVKMFVDECCVLEESLTTLKDELYQAYNSWCQKSGLKAFGIIKFNQQIAKSHDDIRKKGDTNKRWVGIGIR
jgi:putative DNA primase/helicase